jgi:hypothetical protein
LVIAVQQADVEGHKMALHERRFALFVTRRRQTRPGSTASQLLDVNYGPEGIALISAGLATAFPGQVVAAVGLVFFVVAQGRGAPMWVGTALLVLGVAMIGIGVFRYVQGVYAGRRFRGDRAFVRRR